MNEHLRSVHEGEMLISNASSSSSSNFSSSGFDLISPMSCDECRMQHRKCDKLKPICQGCQIRGIECCYSAIPKRKIKKEESMKGKLMKEDLEIVEFYYNETFFQAISREELEKFLLLSYELKGHYSNLEMKEM